MAELSITVTEFGLALHGSLDRGSVDLLGHLPTEATSPGALLLDLAGVRSLDAAGMDGLVHLRDRLARRGIQVVLFDVPAPIWQLFTDAGLAKTFTVIR